MMRSIQRLLYFLSVVVLVTSCNKDELDAMYGKPKDLAPPIYDQLKAKGRFNSFLTLIDKAEYKNILGGAGYWTLFAPNDEAVAKFLQEKGLSSVNDLDKEAAASIVRISMVYNTYLKNQIATYESPDVKLVPGQAFRRKTAYYDFVYDENGKKVIAANSSFGFVLSDNNNKYVPVITSEFLTTANLSVSDYNAFYPNTSFSGFNIADAQVKETDIVAENGIIHEVDKVIVPELSLERYLASKPEYSEFKKLIETGMFYQYDYTLHNRYKALTNKSDSVFVKIYNPAYSFPIGTESYVTVGGTQAQANSYSLMVPTNDQLNAYKTKLLERWGSDQLTQEMTAYLLGAHLFPATLWPSKLTTTQNMLGESVTINPGDIVEKKMASNGPLYGLRTVQPANAFRTVYSKTFLDKDYQLQTRGFNRAIRSQLINRSKKFGIIMQSNAQFLSAGYSFDEVGDNYRYAPATGSPYTSDIAKDRFLRILYSTAFDNSFLNLTDLSGEGVLKGNQGEGEESEYVYYKNNKIYGSGNIELGSEVNVTKVENTDNGPVFFTSGQLLFAERPIGLMIKQLATEQPAIYGNFYSYLTGLGLMPNTTTGEITGITTGVNYTVFIPTNAAIMASSLPKKVDGTPDFAPTDVLAKDKLIANIMYHFIEKRTFAPDGDPEKQTTGTTAYKDIDKADPNTFVSIRSQLGAMQIKGSLNPTNANLIYNNSNKLANKALIHSIDRVLLIK